MKLVMVMCVKNEEDILRDNLLYHFNAGVDYVSVIDNGSEDDTNEILREFEKQGVLQFTVKEDSFSKNIQSWNSRLFRDARFELGADWVMGVDADEFWLPTEGGTLKGAINDIPDEYDACYVSSLNFVNISWSKSVVDMVYRDSVFVGYDGKTRKDPVHVMVKPNRNTVLQDGRHEVFNAKNVAPKDYRPIQSLHFPIRSYEQFEKQVTAAGRDARENAIGRAAYTWRDISEHYDEAGTVHKYYREFDSKSIQKNIALGEIVHDDRLSSFLRKANING